MHSRRLFLKHSALTMFGIGAAPSWLARAASGAGSGRKKVLVTIFQRGAVDGLNMVAPVGEARYSQLRPAIALERNASLDLDGFFALHPSLAPLKAIYDRNGLAIVHAAGSPDPTRSHFDAQDYMESGTPGRKSTRDGWLNRSLSPDGESSPVRAVSLGPALPRALRGRNPAVAVNTIGDFEVRDSMAASMFESMYSKTSDALLSGASRATFEAVKLLRGIQTQPYTPQGGAQYPNGRMGQSLRQIAQLIKADVGLEVAFADVGGWDTHVNQAPVLTNLLRDFATALAAFHQDLGDRISDVVVVTMSEFGRTARENGNRGTDHGHANAMLVMGGPVRGGKVYGDWPGLEQEQLYEGRDLAVTTDFRDVLSEVVQRHLGKTDVKSIFPGYAAGVSRFRGFLI